MSQKNRAPHPTPGDSRRLLAIVASRAIHPTGKIKGPSKPKVKGRP